MSERDSKPQSSLADQVAGLAEEVMRDRADRKKASAVRAERAAVMNSWFSRERTVLVAFVVALPVLGVLIWTNMTGQSLVDLLTPFPPPQLAHQRAQEALDSVVKAVAVYRKDYSELPGNLAEVGVSPQGEWTYAKGPNGNYQIRLKMLGQVVTFNSLRGNAAPGARQP
jgi:hypothetical protein